MKSPLELAIEHCDNSQTELGKRIGKSQSTVGAWMNRFDKRVGDGFVLKVAEATQWNVTPHELKPDIYPHPDDGLPAHLRKPAEFKDRRQPEPRQRRIKSRRVIIRRHFERENAK